MTNHKRERFHVSKSIHMNSNSIFSKSVENFHFAIQEGKASSLSRAIPGKKEWLILPVNTFLSTFLWFQPNPEFSEAGNRETWSCPSLLQTWMASPSNLGVGYSEPTVVTYPLTLLLISNTAYVFFTFTWILCHSLPNSGRNPPTTLPENTKYFPRILQN